MTWAIQDEIMGMPGIGRSDPAPVSPAFAGMLCHAVDSTTGGGAEFIYLPAPAAGIAVPGALVTYNQFLPAVTVLAATGAKGGSPVAVAMAAMAAGAFGWFKVTGNAAIAKTAGTIALGAAVGVTATPGQVASSAGGAATAGALTGAVVNLAAATGDLVVQAQISRPIVN
jgi:hypothetical protein